MTSGAAPTGWSPDSSARATSRRLDLANIPNAGNLDDSLKNVEFDPGRLYSLPWQSGFAGIGYNLKATGGKKIESITQALTDPALKGKVTLLTEMRDTVGLVMMEQGKKIDSFTDADFQAAIDMIQQAKDSGQILRFTGNEYTEGLAKGDIAACVAWTGDVVQASSTTRTSSTPCRRRASRSGPTTSSSRRSPSTRRTPRRLIDYYYDPAVMAQVAAFVNYIAPVKGTAEEPGEDRPRASARTRSSCRRPTCCRGRRSSAASARSRRRSTTRLFSALTTA